MALLTTSSKPPASSCQSRRRSEKSHSSSCAAPFKKPPQVVDIRALQARQRNSSSRLETMSQLKSSACEPAYQESNRPKAGAKWRRRRELEGGCDSACYCCCCCSGGNSSGASSQVQQDRRSGKISLEQACCQAGEPEGQQSRLAGERLRARTRLGETPERSAHRRPNSRQPLCCELGSRAPPSERKSADMDEECAKCQLIARWTAAQASQLGGRPTASRKSLVSGREPEFDVSSLTSEAEEDSAGEEKWSLSSCYAATRLQAGQRSQAEPQSSRPREPAGQASSQRKARRLAPKPPSESAAGSGSGRLSSASSDSRGSLKAAGKPREAPAKASEQAGRLANLLSESEICSIEHFLKSHKSSVYVCGCMANLYLTSTQLVDNGRCSKPSADGWQLNKTGVPVLTFDSGMAKNRERRKLSINLTERGSGFVLWSDIIDHLSNYRAYSTSLDGCDSGRLAEPGKPRGDTCETFHVMYLSSNHRIMVGLSFDDPACARLFLRQVELVTCEPANISLTGPKLARRLASVGKFGRLLERRKRQRCLPDEGRKQRAQSSGSLAEACAATSGGHSLSSGNLCGQQQGSAWSTLKRAIKIGGRRARADARTETGSATGAEAEAEEALLASSLQPKPLAELAMNGRLYRKGKRLPQKCDISAPCLFQHVTRVDLSNLEQLYSSSLVAQASQPPRAQRPAGSGGGEKQQCAGGPLGQQENSSIASTSSCYSSASISPTDSDYGPPLGPTSGPPLVARLANRPKPPKVPQRLCSESRAPPKPDQESQRPAEEKAAAQELSKTKIQAIIRDLEAQTSAELVDAKRKLMADIADQVIHLRRKPSNNKQGALSRL